MQITDIEAPAVYADDAGNRRRAIWVDVADDRMYWQTLSLGGEPVGAGWGSVAAFAAWAVSRRDKEAP